MMKRQLSTLLAAMACSTLLPSCHVFWNTGKRMKENAVTYTGLDLKHPVGDVAYKAPNGKFYLEVPEVTYHIKHRIWGIENHLSPRMGTGCSDDEIVAGMRTTGRTCWIDMKGSVFEGAFSYDANHHKAVPVAGCPAGAKPIPLAHPSWSGNTVWPSQVLQTGSPQIGRTGFYNAAAAPLTYVVDPVLTGVTTAVVYVVAAPFAAVIGVGGAICAPFGHSQQQQRQRDLSDTPRNEP